MPRSAKATAPPDAADDPRDGEWLLARIAHGETAALTRLYHAWGDRLFSMAYHWLGDEGAAREVLQDCFLGVWKRAGDYSPERAKAFTWCAMILRGLCLDQLRKRQRRIVCSQSLEQADFMALPNDPQGVEDLYFRETIARVRSALGRLDATESESVRAALFDPGTLDQHARRWGVPLGTAKTRVHRAMEKLRSLLRNSDSP